MSETPSDSSGPHLSSGGGELGGGRCRWCGADIDPDDPESCPNYDCPGIANERRIAIKRHVRTPLGNEDPGIFFCDACTEEKGDYVWPCRLSPAPDAPVELPPPPPGLSTEGESVCPGCGYTYGRYTVHPCTGFYDIPDPYAAIKRDDHDRFFATDRRHFDGYTGLDVHQTPRIGGQVQLARRSLRRLRAAFGHGEGVRPSLARLGRFSGQSGQRGAGTVRTGWVAAVVDAVRVRVVKR